MRWRCDLSANNSNKFRSELMRYTIHKDEFNFQYAQISFLESRVVVISSRISIDLSNCASVRSPERR